MLAVSIGLHVLALALIVNLQWRVDSIEVLQNANPTINIERQPTPEELQDARIRDREGLP